MQKRQFLYLIKNLPFYLSIVIAMAFTGGRGETVSLGNRTVQVQQQQSLKRAVFDWTARKILTKPRSEENNRWDLLIGAFILLTPALFSHTDKPSGWK